jgi:hypothetical protein
MEAAGTVSFHGRDQKLVDSADQRLNDSYHKV